MVDGCDLVPWRAKRLRPPSARPTATSPGATDGDDIPGAPDSCVLLRCARRRPPQRGSARRLRQPPASPTAAPSPGAPDSCGLDVGGPVIHDLCAGGSRGRGRRRKWCDGFLASCGADAATARGRLRRARGWLRRACDHVPRRAGAAFLEVRVRLRHGPRSGLRGCGFGVWAVFTRCAMLDGRGAAAPLIKLTKLAAPASLDWNNDHRFPMAGVSTNGDEQISRAIPRVECNTSPARPQIIAMEFVVHVWVKFDDSPEGYSGGRVGYMTFLEPEGVDWFVMLENLAYHGYKGNASLYYLKPGYKPPQGLVLMEAAEHLQELMKDHEGLKKCKLFTVKPSRTSKSDGTRNRNPDGYDSWNSDDNDSSMEDEEYSWEGEEGDDDNDIEGGPRIRPKKLFPLRKN